MDPIAGNDHNYPAIHQGLRQQEDWISSVCQWGLVNFVHARGNIFSVFFIVTLLYMSWRSEYKLSMKSEKSTGEKPAEYLFTWYDGTLWLRIYGRLIYVFLTLVFIASNVIVHLEWIISIEHPKMSNQSKSKILLYYVLFYHIILMRWFLWSVLVNFFTNLTIVFCLKFFRIKFF